MGSHHEDRLAEIARHAAPPKGSAARKAIEDHIKSRGLPKQVERLMKRRWREATSLVLTQQKNGAGLEMDRLLRYFHNEFNCRVAEGGVHTLPTSFNVMEASHRFLPEHGVFRLRRERDHLFDLEQFVDFVTSSESPLSASDVVPFFEEDVIYSFGNARSPAGFTITDERGHEFAVGGVSLIRHGLEIDALVLAGQKEDLDEKTEAIRAARPKRVVPYPGKEHLSYPDPEDQCAVPLSDSGDFWRVLALARFDFENNTKNTRKRLPGALVWPGTWSSRSNAMLAEDLVEAGLAREVLVENGVTPKRRQKRYKRKIETEDADGCQLDFHALRVTFVTQLARDGVSLARAQKLARHSTPMLTANVYTRLEVSDGAQAVEQLTRFLPSDEPLAKASS